ncbi:MAG: hypothetical protein INQ03_17365 [Candidatus Heimdallarchaeota archaeon]|nr:hypothetical protein [Candidatus Heimdallarchaeota archaeon]
MINSIRFLLENSNINQFKKNMLLKKLDDYSDLNIDETNLQRILDEFDILIDKNTHEIIFCLKGIEIGKNPLNYIALEEDGVRSFILNAYNNIKDSFELITMKLEIYNNVKNRNKKPIKDYTTIFEKQKEEIIVLREKMESVLIEKSIQHETYDEWIFKLKEQIQEVHNFQKKELEKMKLNEEERKKREAEERKKIEDEEKKKKEAEERREAEKKKLKKREAEEKILAEKEEVKKREAERKQREAEVLSYLISLVNELDAGDDITPENTFKIIAEKFSDLTVEKTRSYLKQIAKNYSEFKFVTLKDVFRKIDIVSLEIEELYKRIETTEIEKIGKT